MKDNRSRIRVNPGGIIFSYTRYWLLESVTVWSDVMMDFISRL
jgi:hypothetical protein